MGSNADRDLWPLKLVTRGIFSFPSRPSSSRSPNDVTAELTSLASCIRHVVQFSCHDIWTETCAIEESVKVSEEQAAIVLIILG